MSKKEILLPAIPIQTFQAWENKAIIFEFSGRFDEVNELLLKAKTVGVPIELYPQGQANKKDLFKLTVTFERSQFIKFVNLLAENLDNKTL